MMNRQFSIKNYLINKCLASKEGNLLTIDRELPTHTSWSLGPYCNDTAMIYLCTTIHVMENYGVLDNLDIILTSDNDLYNIHINEISRIEQNDRAYQVWDGALKTLDFLIPCMAASNVSWLADGLFWEN